MKGRVLALASLLAAAALGAPSLGAQGAGRTHLVLITGASGEPRIAEAWQGQALALWTAATTRLGLAREDVTWLGEDSTRDARMAGRSTRATVERVLGGLAARLGVSDRLVVVLWAHGSALGDQVKVNLPGPDMTPDDFRRVLAPATKPEVAFIHTGSASGDFAPALMGPRRIVVTATKSAREQNETLFPGYFTQALTTDVADADKDGRTSILEAFAYAQHEVERVFTQGNRLATEHPQLADGADGGRARAFTLAAATGATVPASPEAERLLRERAEVQARVDALRAKKGDMGEEAYQRALEPLMVELAEKSRALRALTAGGKP